MTLEQKAVLEFVYIEILGDVIGRRQGPGVPNLELYVEQHPELFVQAICWAFRRRDEGEDAPEMIPGSIATDLPPSIWTWTYWHSSHLA